MVLVLLVVQELRCRKEENASGGFRIVLPSIMMVELSRVGMALTWLSCLLRKVLDSLTSLSISSCEIHSSSAEQSVAHLVRRRWVR